LMTGKGLPADLQFVNAVPFNAQRGIARPHADDVRGCINIRMVCIVHKKSKERIWNANTDGG
jgi:hypothetical protein